MVVLGAKKEEFFTKSVFNRSTMESLNNIYELNRSIDVLRRELIDLLYNESERSLVNDPVVLIRVNKIQTKYRKLAYQRSKEVNQAYSHTVVRPKTVSKIESITVLLTVPKLKMASMIIGKNSTQLSMTPKWFNPEDEENALKTIKYPSNVVKKRPFNTVARFRTAHPENTSSNDFNKSPIEVKQDATETLVLALDAFVQQFDGKLSFTDEDLSFENSAHRTACGVADLGSAHLLSNGHIPSARFALIIDIDYDDLARSKETMSQFLLTFVDAIAHDLQCDNDYVRVSSVEKSKKGRGKSEVNLVLTTPDKMKTEELAEILQVNIYTHTHSHEILSITSILFQWMILYVLLICICRNIAVRVSQMVPFCNLSNEIIINVNGNQFYRFYNFNHLISIRSLIMITQKKMYLKSLNVVEFHTIYQKDGFVMHLK